ncbi:MAG: EF-hand domain-containing protein, partial [Candidatus Latescibacterota bacterium]
MFKLLVLAGSVLAFATAPAMAGGHMEMEPPPGIFIPIPPDVELPPPEDGPEMFVEFAMSFLDKDGDGVISHEELMEALMAGMHHDGDGMHHDGDGMHDDGDGMHHDGDGMHD